MLQGRPFSLSQEDPDTEPPAVPAIESPPPPRPDRMANALVFSGTWAPEPCIPMQAQAYPDTVKVVDVRYRIFDTSNPADMDDYSKIWLSHHAKGSRVFDSNETLEWDANHGRWKLLVRVATRAFKTTHTSQTNPDE